MRIGTAKRAAVIMTAVAMLLPSCTVAPALAEEGTAGEKKAIEMGVAKKKGVL